MLKIVKFPIIRKKNRIDYANDCLKIEQSFALFYC